MTSGDRSPGPETSGPGHDLPDWSSVLAVVAHPDDESFGLGAVLSAFVERGSSVSVVCFTQGEASTLGSQTADLAAIRAGELMAAARVLGVDEVRLGDHPDGALQSVDPQLLTGEVLDFAGQVAADGIVAFDPSGVTGHPDHQRATEVAAAVAETLGIGVLAWTLPDDVAATVRQESGAPLAGHARDEIDLTITVDRTRQREAVTCHPSQAVPTSILWRRLELLGPHEHLRWLRHRSDAPPQ